MRYQTKGRGREAYDIAQFVEDAVESLKDTGDTILLHTWLQEQGRNVAKVTTLPRKMLKEIQALVPSGYEAYIDIDEAGLFSVAIEKV